MNGLDKPQPFASPAIVVMYDFIPPLGRRAAIYRDMEAGVTATYPLSDLYGSGNQAWDAATDAALMLAFCNYVKVVVAVRSQGAQPEQSEIGAAIVGDPAPTEPQPA